MRIGIRKGIRTGINPATVIPPSGEFGISNVSGTVSHGNNVTISGAQFGTGDASPLLWDDFESGTPANNLNASPEIGNWTLLGNNTVYSTTSPHSGSQCAYSIYSGDYANFSGPDVSGADRLYWSFWYNYHLSSPTGSQVKTIQLHGNAPASCDFGPGIMSGSQNGQTDWHSYNIVSGSNCTHQIEGYYSFNPSQDNWHFVELILERSTQGVSDGTIIIKVNNNTVLSGVGNVMTREDGYDWDEPLFLYAITNSATGTYFSIDDAYLNNSWSRVMLGNAATYSACTELNVLPVSAWSDASITARVNAGALTAGAAYLYVIDADGNTTAGYQVTVI